MGQYIDIIEIYIGDTEIIARFLARQLRVSVLVVCLLQLFILFGPIRLKRDWKCKFIEVTRKKSEEAENAAPKMKKSK